MRLTITSLLLALVPASWALAGLNTTTVSFQQGANGYTNAVDQYIFQNGAGGVNGSTIPNFTLIPAGVAGNEQQGLYRFDSIFGSNPGQIPLGAKIVDASLQLSTIGGVSTGSTDQTNGPFGVAGLTAPFDATTTWTSYPANHGAWFEDNTATRAQGEYGRLDLGETQRADIRSVVQSWSDGGANNGLAVTGGQPSGTDTWRILTNGNASVGSHPKLSVTYTTDNVALNTFQRGLNGYTNVDSVRVSSKCNTDGTACTAGPGAGATAD